MGKRITDRNFFTRPAEELAKDLIGKLICHKCRDERGEFTIRARIKTTEAYQVTDDVTDANRYGKNSQLLDGGHLYFCNDWPQERFDIVAGHSGEAESVLIRDLDAYEKGPNNASWAMDISIEDDGADLLDENGMIWLEDDGTVAELKAPAKRKGIEKSKYADALLQFSAKSFTFPD